MPGFAPPRLRLSFTARISGLVPAHEAKAFVLAIASGEDGEWFRFWVLVFRVYMISRETVKKGEGGLPKKLLALAWRWSCQISEFSGVTMQQAQRIHRRMMFRSSGWCI